jgi:pSer/pThr/pTyr-binding forkhead associated (FHA) protein
MVHTAPSGPLSYPVAPDVEDVGSTGVEVVAIDWPRPTIEFGPATPIAGYPTVIDDDVPLPAPPSGPGVLVVSGPAELLDRFFDLDRGVMRIGRSIENDVSIDDPQVSRYQAEIVFLDGVYIARDLNSRNPTVVNGAPLLGELPLKHGDTIGMGRSALRFVWMQESGG